MLKAIRAVHALKRAGVIEEYAIYGAVAVIYHGQPRETDDIDVLVLVRPASGLIVDVGPIYQFLRRLGHTMDEHHAIIGGVRLDLAVPASGSLEEEAVKKAVTAKAFNTRVRIVRLEHLMALKIKAGRYQDLGDIERLLAQAKVNRRALGGILRRYGLLSRWAKAFGRLR